jgi:hypothetical protein
MATEVVVTDEFAAWYEASRTLNRIGWLSRSGSWRSAG